MKMNDHEEELRSICHIMDLQVVGNFNHEQIRRYWLNVMSSVPPETIATALALKLPQYQWPHVQRGVQ